MSLQNNKVVIVGERVGGRLILPASSRGSSGIGLATAKVAVAAGALVVIASRSALAATVLYLMQNGYTTGSVVNVTVEAHWYDASA